MVPKKSRSKRKTIRQQYTARKLFFMRKRKAKKLAKRAAKEGKVIQKQRDPGIPNSWPFKEELLQEMQDIKEQKEQQKAELREKRRQEKMKEEAIARGEEVPESDTEMEEEEDPGVIPRGDNAAILTHIINNSDVILEVVDARDPINSRCFSVEKAIAEEMPEKVIIIILNKIDLVPRDILEKTIANLSAQFPVVCWMNHLITYKKKSLRKSRPFGITHHNRNNEYKNYDFGYNYLMELLQQIQKTRNELISVGVIGYPKTGRHSVIQTITNKSPVFQSDRLGYDDLNQLRRIDVNIHFFIQPGEVVLMQREQGKCDYLLKCYAGGFEGIKYRRLCEELIETLDKVGICYYYRTSMYNSYADFIKEMEERQNDQKNLRNRTVPKQIINDWLSNDLPHYAEPCQCKYNTIDNATLKKWKEGMRYDEVMTKMMKDELLNKFCCPKYPRVFVTPNIEPVEEELDMSCFLPASEKGDNDDDDDDDEIPQLVDEDEEEGEEGEEEGEEDNLDEDAKLLE